MSKLDELIAELCPDGVPYKTLGELGYFYGGLSGKSKEDFTNGNAKFITYMNVFTNLAIDTDISDLVRIGENEKQNTVQYGDILFTGSSETPDECGMSSVLTEVSDEKFYLNSFCFGFRLKDNNLLLPDFSKYLFRSQNIRKQIIRNQKI
jgi:type I restriction enzyme S subunit